MSKPPEPIDRRSFFGAAAATAAASTLLATGRLQSQDHASADSPAEHAACGPGFATPADAIAAPREKLLYTVGLYVGTGAQRPDYLATIDADPASPTYSRVIHRLEMPQPGDELHHFGWNTCSSCHADASQVRNRLIIPGLASSNIHIVDTSEPAAPTLVKTILGDNVRRVANLSAPHTVHCLADGNIMISMLGDAEGNGPGGFLLLDEDFDVAGHWERGSEGMNFNYDFWYQPRHNVMVTSEWAAPKTYSGGFNPQEVAAGKYGRQINFWNWQARTIEKSVDLGETGMIPLEVRFHHNPDSTHGYVGAALSSTMWHWEKKDGDWDVQKVIEVPPVGKEGWPFPVPALITDLLISMDDRFLYFSNWLHGDVRQYDISDPGRPRLTGQVWCGGVLGKTGQVAGRQVAGGPQMLQLSLDGKRLYVTSSLLSSWDNQFYPDMAKQGSYLVQIDCDTAGGGMKINDNFFVDFGKEPHGPARAHEIRYPGGDCTSDIFA
jgi:selenium-binding protein 1